MSKTKATTNWHHDYKKKCFLIVACQTNPQLRPIDKSVMTLLIWHCNPEHGRCFPAQTTIAQELNVSSRMVRYAIAQLKEKGWIKVKDKTRFKQSNRYELAWERAWVRDECSTDATHEEEADCLF